MKHCSYCGASSNDSVNFCIECGTRLVPADLSQYRTSSRVAQTEQLSEVEKIFEEQQRQYAESQYQEVKERVEHQKKVTQRNHSINLKSVLIGEILISLLLIMIGFNSIDIVASLIGIPRNIIQFIEYFIIFFERFLFFVWVYLLHVDLKNIFHNYPITPIGAVFRYIFPIFLWGIWSTFFTLASRLQKENSDLTYACEKIRLLIIYSYVFISISFTSYAFSHNNLLRNISQTTTSKLSEISTLSSFFEVLVNVGTNVVDLLLVQTVTQAIIRKLKLEEYSYIE